MSRRRLRPVRIAKRLRILKRDNYTCQYCFEAATEVDHIIPYSYIPDNSDGNLVASCGECNRLAHNMVFASFNEKYMYIKRRREQRGNRSNLEEWHATAVRGIIDEAPKPSKVIKLPKAKVIKPPRVRVVKPLKEKIVKPPVPRPFAESVPVTDALKSHITTLRNGQTWRAWRAWRALRDELPGWKWSHSLLADIASGKVASTSLAVYEALGIMSPLVIFAGPGSIIIGSGQGLLSPDQAVVYVQLPPDEWKRHSIKCATCGEPTPRWSASQKYCPAHSWQTAEGRKYQRGRRAEARI